MISARSEILQCIGFVAWMAVWLGFYSWISWELSNERTHSQQYQLADSRHDYSETCCPDWDRSHRESVAQAAEQEAAGR